MPDSIVQDEIKRIHAPAQQSEFEWMVLNDILQYAHEKSMEYHLDPKRCIREFWETKLE